jgi:hypothetical protein
VLRPLSRGSPGSAHVVLARLLQAVTILYIATMQPLSSQPGRPRPAGQAGGEGGAGEGDVDVMGVSSGRCKQLRAG